VGIWRQHQHGIGAAYLSDIGDIGCAARRRIFICTARHFLSGSRMNAGACCARRHRGAAGARTAAQAAAHLAAALACCCCCASPCSHQAHPSSREEKRRYRAAMRVTYAARATHSRHACWGEQKGGPACNAAARISYCDTCAALYRTATPHLFARHVRKSFALQKNMRLLATPSCRRAPALRPCAARIINTRQKSCLLPA